MNENKLANGLLSGLLILSVVMFSWTYLYINDIAHTTTNIPIVSAFDA